MTRLKLCGFKPNPLITSEAEQGMSGFALNLQSLSLVGQNKLQTQDLGSILNSKGYLDPILKTDQ